MGVAGGLCRFPVDLIRCAGRLRGVSAGEGPSAARLLHPTALVPLFESLQWVDA